MYVIAPPVIVRFLCFEMTLVSTYHFQYQCSSCLLQSLCLCKHSDRNVLEVLVRA